MKEEGMVGRPGMHLLNEIFVCANKPGKVGLEEKMSHIHLLLGNAASYSGPTQLSVSCSTKTGGLRESLGTRLSTMYTLCVQHVQFLIACSMQKQGNSLMGRPGNETSSFSWSHAQFVILAGKILCCQSLVDNGLWQTVIPLNYRLFKSLQNLRWTTCTMYAYLWTGSRKHNQNYTICVAVRGSNYHAVCRYAKQLKQYCL